MSVSRASPTPFVSIVFRRQGAVWLFLGAFVLLSFAIRLSLLAKSADSVSWDASLLAVFGWGMLFDLGCGLWLSLPLTVLLAVLPGTAFRNKWVRVTAGAGVFGLLYALLFGATAEWFFWDEFGVRFNFIAVDYLVYTTEVLGNIWESYPMPAILGGIGVLALALTVIISRSRWSQDWLNTDHGGWRSRCAIGGGWSLAVVAAGSALSSGWLPSFKNNYNGELAKNGLWSLVAAFKANELDYEQFYATRPIGEAFDRLRHELKEDGSILLRPGELDSLRYVSNPGPELKPNIIQITVESLSAAFLGTFNPESDLTPNLDALAGESLVFTNLFATGTRTVRGMEALTLSLPPTPGSSIVKRPRNDGLFTLGSVLRAKGYDTAFLYGGYGYFDNMNAFFSGNGYRVVDRSSVGEDDVSFATVWGACDEDLYRWTLREADAGHEKGQPFHYFLMTTSNHRPYAFPEGRIDLPPKVSGRAGAVKYTDYAIGQFLREASTRPWFKDTIFVIVADHCASSAGRTEVPVQNYHIPMFIYAPGRQIAPGRIDRLASQMDFAPTLLGLLNWSYPSRFFGHDVRRVRPDDAHALLGTYQKLGHLEDGEFVLLEPPRSRVGYRLEALGGNQVECEPSEHGQGEAIGFYQAASYMYSNGLYRELTPEEFRHYSMIGETSARGIIGGVAAHP